MLGGLLSDPSLADLDNLLAADQLREDICGLAPAGEVLDASQFLAEADAKRAEACEQMQGGGANGPAAMAVGMSADACVNIDLSGARNTFGENEDGYGLDDQFADLEACVAGLVGDGMRIAGPNLVANGWVKAIPLLVELAGQLGGDKQKTEGILTTLAKEGVGTAGHLGRKAGEALIDHYKAQADYDLKMKQASDQLGIEIAGLQAEVDAAQASFDELNGDVNALQSQLNEFNGDGFRQAEDGTWTNLTEDGKTAQDLKDELATKTAQRDAAKKNLDEKKTKLESAKAMKKAIDDQRDKDDGLDPEAPDACERAMFGGEQFGEEALAESLGSWEDRLAPVINPGPDGPVPGDQPRDGLALPACGQGPGSQDSSCAEAATCLEGEACGCSGDPESSIPSEEELVALVSAEGRCAQIQCADGFPTLVGATCVCSDYGDDGDVTVPPKPPVTALLVESFFVGADDRVGYAGADPLSMLIDGML